MLCDVWILKVNNNALPPFGRWLAKNLWGSFRQRRFSEGNLAQPALNKSPVLQPKGNPDRRIPKTSYACRGSLEVSKTLRSFPKNCFRALRSISNSFKNLLKKGSLRHVSLVRILLTWAIAWSISCKRFGRNVNEIIIKDVSLHSPRLFKIACYLRALNFNRIRVINFRHHFYVSVSHPLIQKHSETPFS